MNDQIESKIKWIPAIFLVILLLGGIVPMMADAEETGNIGGVVFDSETQLPIVGALVYHNNSKQLWKTDERGYFMMEGLPYGDYEITVYKEGYNTSQKTINLNRYTNGTILQLPLYPSIPIAVGVLTGKVYLEAEFDTVSGLYTADDAIVGFESSSNVPTGTIIDVTESTSDTLVGKYITSVLPGTHNLFCWAYSHQEEHSGSLSVSAGEVVRYDFHLEAIDMHNSGLAGNITDSTTGEPVPGANVIAQNEETGDLLTTVANSDGFYFFTAPQPGDYTVVAMATGYNPNSGTGTVVWDHATYVDIELEPKPLNTTVLWGFVFGDGFPISYGTVFTDYYLTMSTDMFGIPGLYIIDDFPGDEEHGVGANAIGFYPQLHYLTVPSGTTLRHDFYLQSMDMNFTRFAIVIASVWEDTTPRNPLPNSDVRLWGGSYDQTLGTGSSHNTVMFIMVPSGTPMNIKGSNGGYIYERYVYKPGDIHHAPTDTFTPDVFVINYVDIYMNETQPVNKTEIWGYVYVNTFSIPVPGANVMELMPGPGIFDVTDSLGYYQQFVSPDTYGLQALFPGGYSVQFYDYATSSSGAGPWSGTVIPGESRHVDFIMKMDNKEFSIIAGQVRDYSTHTPVTGFEVKAYNSAQLFPAINVDPFGHFMFSPITDFATDWTVDGYGPGHSVSLVEYDFLSSWTPMTHPNLPVDFTHAPVSVMWLNIYVNQSEPPTEKTKLWGKVFLDDFGGVEIGGVPVMEHLVSPGLFDVTDSSGIYSDVVPSGVAYELDISFPSAYSIRYYDHVTGATGVGAWSDTVTGLDYRVDFAFKIRTKEYAEILGQVTLDSDGSPVSGFTMTAENMGGSTRPPQTTDPFGLFDFNPVVDLSSDWIVDGSHPSYSVASVEYHLLGGGSPTSASTLPVDFPLSSMEIMWVDIKVKEVETQYGKAVGKVYLLPDNGPAVGAEVKIIRIGESTPTDTETIGNDGLYNFYVPSGDYTIKVTLSGYMPQSEVVTVPGSGTVYQSFYLPPSGRVSDDVFEPITMKIIDQRTGEPADDLPVMILGVGKNKTDSLGVVGFDIFTTGYYTLSVGVEILSISNETVDNATVKDGRIYMEPGKDYTLYVKLSEVETETKTEEGEGDEGEVSMAVLIAGIIGALVIGGIAGYMARRPEKMDMEE